MNDLRFVTDKFTLTANALGVFGCQHIRGDGVVQHSIRCPFCDTKNCATLWPNGNYRCWRCGIHGDAWDILGAKGFGWQEAQAFFADECNIYAPIPRRKRYVPSWQDDV